MQTGIFVLLFLANIAGMFIFYRILRSRFSSKKILSELRSEVDKLILDLGRETDRDVGLLESRIKGLRSLIDEADKRIVLADREEAKRRDSAAFEAGLTGSARKVEVSSVTPGELPFAAASGAAQDAPSASPTPPAASRVPPVLPTPAASAARPPAEPGTSENPVTIYTRQAARRSPDRIVPEVPLRERVVSMARQGFTAELIASTLSVSLGEVELILDMNSSSL